MDAMHAINLGTRMRSCSELAVVESHIDLLVSLCATRRRGW
jgi:hypothetical protein